MDLDYLKSTDPEAYAVWKELDNLIEGGLEDSATGETADATFAVKMVREELEDELLYQKREAIVQQDLIKHFDNPSVPTAHEKFTMLEDLGADSLWYEKWERERMEAYNESQDILELETSQTWAEQKAVKDLVDEAFKHAEIEEMDTEILQKSIRIISDHEFTMAQTQVEKYENLNSISGDIELQRIDIAEFERMPYYSIDEASQPISQMTLEALDGAQTSGVGWDLIPTVSEAIEAGAEFASGSLFGLAAYGLVEGMTPIIKSLLDTDWIANPALTPERKREIKEAKGILEYYGGGSDLTRRILDHFKKNTINIWYHDSVNARIKTKIRGGWGSDPGLLYSSSMTPCSGLWVKGRVLYIEGTKLGFSDDWQIPLAACIQTKTKKFWIDAGRASILRDSAQVQNAANSKNLGLVIFNNIKNWPWHKTAPKETDQDILDRLAAGVSKDSWEFTEIPTESPDLDIPIRLNEDFEKNDRVVYRKPKGERVHGTIASRSGLSQYVFLADDPSRVGSDRLLVNFDTISAESEKYTRWKNNKDKRERLKERKTEQHKDWVERKQDSIEQHNTKDAVRARMRAAWEGGLPMTEPEIHEVTYNDSDLPFAQIGKSEVQVEHSTKQGWYDPDSVFNMMRRRLPESGYREAHMENVKESIDRLDKQYKQTDKQFKQTTKTMRTFEERLDTESSHERLDRIAYCNDILAEDIFPDVAYFSRIARTYDLVDDRTQELVYKMQDYYKDISEAPSGDEIDELRASLMKLINTIMETLGRPTMGEKKAITWDDDKTLEGLHRLYSMCTLPPERFLRQINHEQYELGHMVLNQAHALVNVGRMNPDYYDQLANHINYNTAKFTDVKAMMYELKIAVHSLIDIHAEMENPSSLSTGDRGGGGGGGGIIIIGVILALVLMS